MDVAGAGEEDVSGAGVWMLRVSERLEWMLRMPGRMLRKPGWILRMPGRMLRMPGRMLRMPGRTLRALEWMLRAPEKPGRMVSAHERLE